MWQDVVHDHTDSQCIISTETLEHYVDEAVQVALSAMGWFCSLLIIFFPFFHIMVLLVWQSWWPYRSKQTSQKAPTTDQQFLCTFSLYQSPHGYRYEATSRQLCEEICWGDLINHTPVWTPLQMTSLTDVNTHMTLWEQEAAYKLMLSKVGLESKVCELHSHYLQFGSRLARSFRIRRLCKFLDCGEHIYSLVQQLTLDLRSLSIHTSHACGEFSMTTPWNGSGELPEA